MKKFGKALPRMPLAPISDSAATNRTNRKSTCTNITSDAYPSMEIESQLEKFENSSMLHGDKDAKIDAMEGIEGIIDLTENKKKIKKKANQATRYRHSIRK